MLNVSKIWISCPFFPVPPKLTDIKVLFPKVFFYLKALSLWNHSISYDDVLPCAALKLSQNVTVSLTILNICICHCVQASTRGSSPSFLLAHKTFTLYSATVV